MNLKRLRIFAAVLFFFCTGFFISAQEGETIPSFIVEQEQQISVQPEEVPQVQVAEETAFLTLPIVKNSEGASAFFFEAKKLEGDTSKKNEKISDVIRFMYTLAFRFGEPSAAKEAGRTLVALASADQDYTGAISLAQEWRDAFGLDWDIERTVFSSYAALSDFKSMLEEIDSVKKNYSSTAKAKASELTWYEYSARAELSDSSWLPQALALLKAAYPDSWNIKVFRLIAKTETAAETDRELASMRADYYEKKYEAAKTHVLRLNEFLSRAGSLRIYLSEAGKSLVGAQAGNEGVAFFSKLITGQNQEPEIQDSYIYETLIPFLAQEKIDEKLWISGYYLARLLQVSNREQLAGIIFLDLTDNAPTSADADSALWYWMDITMRRIADTATDELDSADSTVLRSKRSLEFAALLEASQRWKNPSFFDDILDRFSRTILKEKNHGDILVLNLLLADRISVSMKTRWLYLCGRLIEEGLAVPQSALQADQNPENAQNSVRQELPALDRQFAAKPYFESILAIDNAEEYYRTMASWRLGRDIPFLKSIPQNPNGSRASILTTSTNGKAIAENGYSEKLKLVKNYLLYDLDEIAAATATSLIGSIDSQTLAGLAFDLSSENQHYAALRLAREAIYRGAASQYPGLFALLYPKAWNEPVRQFAQSMHVPEALLYGIIRSESAFNPRAVSSSGAVGLTQLMPATARETAAGLKMSNYSLTNPEDNLKIGLTYYSYMLARFNNKPMRAMFAYNAGPGRMITWNKESGELPDDILLETLHLAEPKQYAKNIIQAALAYGKIHYDVAEADMLNFLVLGKPIPDKAVPAPEPAATAEAVIVPPASETPASASGDSAKIQSGNVP